jgi:CheY-like chemotaxis protein
MPSQSPVVLALVGDLFFLSRLQSAAAARGARVERVSQMAEASARVAALMPALIVLDMVSAGEAWLEALRQLKDGPAADTPVVAFGPHVDTTSQAAARAAGADRVLSNSRLVQSLPALLEQYLPSAAGES